VIFVYALCLVKHNITKETASLLASEFVMFDKTQQVNKNRTSEPTTNHIYIYIYRYIDIGTEIYSKKIMSVNY